EEFPKKAQATGAVSAGDGQQRQVRNNRLILTIKPLLNRVDYRLTPYRTRPPVLPYTEPVYLRRPQPLPWLNHPKKSLHRRPAAGAKFPVTNAWKSPLAGCRLQDKLHGPA